MISTVRSSANDVKSSFSSSDFLVVLGRDWNVSLWRNPARYLERGEVR